MRFQDRLEELRNNQYRRQAQVHKETSMETENKLKALQVEHDALKADFSSTKRMLSVHERGAKKRADGLKKAQAARKKSKK